MLSLRGAVREVFKPESFMSSSAFKESAERYAEIGVDVENAIQTLSEVPISMHCWQGDDVGGFENPDATLGSGLAVTGNYPGKAGSIDELRQDIEKAMSLVPGQHRLNLHAIYGDFSSGKADRDAIEVKHFQSWIDWCKAQRIGMDFNPTCFSHPKADEGMTLAHSDSAIRQFWIEHCKCCRRIAAEVGKQLGSACVNNIWVPDGMKDSPADRTQPRQRLMASLDEVLEVGGRAPGLELVLLVARRARGGGEVGAALARLGRKQTLRHRLGNLRGGFARLLPRLRH